MPTQETLPRGGAGLARAAARTARALLAPVDGSSLAFFRIAFGALALWEVSRFWQFGWIEAHLLEPAFHFKYLGFGWVKPWPGNGLYWHFGAIGVAGVLVMAGLFYRIAAAALFVGLTYVFLLEQATYLNHFYLVCLVAGAMVLIPAHQTFSLDAWRGRGPGGEGVPAWSVELIRAHMGIVYLYAGFAKMNPDWLAGWPLRLWLPMSADFPLIGPLFHEAWVAVLFSWCGLALDTLAWPALVWRRTRPFAFVALLGFHLMNARMFDIGIFPWLSIAATAMFFPPDWPRRVLAPLLARLGFDGSQVPEATLEGPVRPIRTRERFVLGALAVYLCFQLLFPFRHWLYPGNVAWTEEGHLFSWRQKLRHKNASVEWYVTDTRTQRTYPVVIDGFLTRRQFQKMSTRPDMLLQFAHFIGQRYREQLGGEVEVRARVLASLNAREPQLLIDPNVDLMKQPRTIRPRPWILPLEAERN